MEVSFEVHKIIKFTMYNTVFFTSGENVDEMLVRLLLIEENIEDANSMCISFSVKHSQTFRES